MRGCDSSEKYRGMRSLGHIVKRLTSLPCACVGTALCHVCRAAGGASGLCGWFEAAPKSPSNLGRCKLADGLVQRLGRQLPATVATSGAAFGVAHEGVAHTVLHA